MADDALAIDAIMETGYHDQDITCHVKIRVETQPRNDKESRRVLPIIFNHAAMRNHIVDNAVQWISIEFLMSFPRRSLDRTQSTRISNHITKPYEYKITQQFHSLYLIITQIAMAVKKSTLHGFADAGGSSPAFSHDPIVPSVPGYAINEFDGKYQIAMDAQGVEASDINVRLEKEGRVMHIIGRCKKNDDKGVLEAKFEKHFTIGNDVDTDKLTANLTDGVLNINALKLEMPGQTPENNGQSHEE